MGLGVGEAKWGFWHWSLRRAGCRGVAHLAGTGGVLAHTRMDTHAHRLAHTATNRTPCTGAGHSMTLDPRSEARASHITKVMVPSQAGPERISPASVWGTSCRLLGMGLLKPGQPSAPCWALWILTLPGHHPLRVPLGQHPRVPIEAGLLHLRERERSNRETPLTPVRVKHNPGLRTVCWRGLGETDRTLLVAEALGPTTLQDALETALPTRWGMSRLPCARLGAARRPDRLQ